MLHIKYTLFIIGLDHSVTYLPNLYFDIDVEKNIFVFS